VRRWHHLHWLHDFIAQHYEPMSRLPRTSLQVWGVTKNWHTAGQYVTPSSRVLLWLGRDIVDQCVTVVHELAHHLVRDYGTRDWHDEAWHLAYFQLAEWLVSLSNQREGYPPGRMFARYKENLANGHNDGPYGHTIADTLVSNAIWASGWDLTATEQLRAVG
jgi:hypothetical protein